tara:strand:- start:669 stop:827 length:159 start_codon:yes stop_codon:yes gene_type:complete
MNIGDLVMSEISGRVGIVLGRDNLSTNDYWLVMIHDRTLSIHRTKLKPLEVK